MATSVHCNNTEHRAARAGLEKISVTRSRSQGGNSVVVYLLAPLAALANASSSMLQRRANRDEPDDASLSLRLVLDLLHRPVSFGCVSPSSWGSCYKRRP
jgi:hypothetical protein